MAAPSDSTNQPLTPHTGAAAGLANAQDPWVLYRHLQARYQTLVNVIGQGYYIGELVYDQAGQAVDWRYLEVNAVFEQQTGLQNPVGQLNSAVAPNPEPYWSDAFQRVVQSGEAMRLEKYNAFTQRWYTAHITRVGGAGSWQFAVVFDDTTERKRYERQQDYLLMLSDSLRSIADPVAIEAAVAGLAMQYFDADRCYYCRIDEGNAIISRDAMRGNLPSVANTYPLSSFALLQRVVDEGKPFVVHDASTTPILDETLRATCLQLQVISFVDVPVIKNGKAAGVLCLVQSTPRIWTDVEVQLAVETAERIWAAVERAKAEEEIREANRRKDEFMAMLGHELRNPLATINNTLLLLELTQGADASLPYDKAVRLMSRETNHLNRMVDDLLDMSRIRQGKIRLERQQLDLRGIVGQTVDAARPLYRQQSRHIAFPWPASPMHVYGDATRLTQVVMNLLTNGLKYTTDEGHVWVSLETRDRMAVLHVSDDGIGIRRDELRAIFEVFVQGNTSLDRPQGGLGLGLAVVKQIVEGHGGRIDAASKGPGQGSEFRIEIPLLTDKFMSTEPVSTDAMRPVQFSPLGRVLVVDDNKDLADTTARLIQMSGYEVHTCYSGEDALATALTVLPRAILLDIGMPHLDGYAVCRQIRRQDWGQAMVVIAMSGYREGDKERSKAVGFDDYLLKPINYQVLTEMLANYVGTRNI